MNRLTLAEYGIFDLHRCATVNGHLELAQQILPYKKQSEILLFGGGLDSINRIKYEDLTTLHEKLEVVYLCQDAGLKVLKLLAEFITNSSLS